VSPADLLTDAFGRIHDTALAAIDGLSDDQLAQRPTPDANSIAWLVWHLTRVQDDHVADVAGAEQVYTAQAFAARFDLPFGDDATGYGFSSEDVARTRASAELLGDYLRAVTSATTSYLSTLQDDDFDRVVDEGWDPPVTLAVRLVSVVSDDLQHAGQAAYARGLLTKR
jgi:uncharacterized damage-inducible protein DinB